MFLEPAPGERGRFSAGRFVLCVVLVLGSVAASLVIQGGGFLETKESYFFLQNYLADRDLAAVVFDVQQNDWGRYQARELSYLVDFLDAQFIRASIAAGIPHFYPASHYASLILIAGVFLLWCRRYLSELPFPHALLLTLLFLTSPACFYATYFRSSKILVGLLLALLIWFAFYAGRLVRPVPHGRDSRGGESGEGNSAPRLFRLLRWRDVSITFAIAMLLTLVDRQGFVFTLGLAGIMAVAYWIAGESRYLACATIVFAASIANLLYNLILGPGLIFHTNGYVPRFDFQSLGFLLNRLAPAGGASAASDIAAVMLIPEYVSHFFGNIGVAGGVAAILGIGLAFGLDVPGSQRASTSHGWWRRHIAFGAFAASFLGLSALNWILVQRAPYLLWIENKLIYYAIPTIVLTLIAAGVAFDRLFRSRPGLRIPLAAILLACLVGNVVSLSGHHRDYVEDKSSWTGFERADLLRDCLRRGAADSIPPGLDQSEAAMCRFLRAKAGLAPLANSEAGTVAFDTATRFRIGDGVEKSERKAASWLRRSAEAGLELAQIDLASRYRDGRGVDVDRVQQVRWLRAAAESGDPASQFSLYQLYALDEGDPSLRSESPQWLQRAAAAGDLMAQRTVGIQYMTSAATPGNRVRAHMWLTLSSNNAFFDTPVLLEKLESSMSEPTIQKARRLAENWRPARWTRR